MEKECPCCNQCTVTNCCHFATVTGANYIERSHNLNRFQCNLHLMSPETPLSDPPSLAEEWRDSRERASTRDRVYAVALQLYDPTRVADVADRADVAKETAREYLKWFVELGVLVQIGQSPDTFKRNEHYFQWRRIQRLQSLSREERTQQLKQLTETEREYRQRFDADTPTDVNALEHADYAALEEVWLALQEWQTVRRRIRELEQARQQHDDDDRAHA